MKPVIIFMNVGEGKINKLRPILNLMGIGIKIIDQSRMGDSVGYIAYPDEFENKPEPSGGESFGEEFMLLCGMDPKNLDAVLNFMRKGKMSIGLKAMLTETNSSWTLGRLISEISAERKMIAASLKNKRSK